MLHKTIPINSNIKKTQVIVLRLIFVLNLDSIRIDSVDRTKNNPNTTDTNNFKFSGFILENFYSKL